MTQTLKHDVLKINYMNRTGIVSNYSLFMKQFHRKEKLACVTHLETCKNKAVFMHHSENRQITTHLMLVNYSLSRS